MNQSGSSNLSVECQADKLEQLCVVLTDILARTDGHIIGKVYALRSVFSWNIGSLFEGRLVFVIDLSFAISPHTTGQI